MANTALARAVNAATFVAGQLLTFTDLRRIQNAAREAAIELFIGRLFLNGTTLRDGFFGDDCLVTSSGGLNYSVAAGMGLMYDSTVTDEFTTQYRPIVVPSAITGTLGAHDASNPRIDIICLAPDFATDTSESINVKAGDGSISSTTADRRQRYYRAIQVVAGTPAGSPAAPAVPTGYLKLCQCAVPAVSGDIVVTDSRALMVLSQGALGLLSIATANIQASAVTAAKIATGTITATKMATKPVYASLSAAAESGNTITVTIQIKDVDGNNVTGSYDVELVLKSRNGDVFTGSDYTVTVGAFGTRIAGAHDVGAGNVPYLFIRTNSGSGVAEVVVTDVVTGANRGVQLFANVINAWGRASWVDCPFN